MQIELMLDKNMRFVANNNRGHETVFDTVEKVGGDNSAATPMEIMLESLAGCSSMDVVSILRKKRKKIEKFSVKIEAERATKHPKKFTEVHMIYELESPDAELKDLERSVELSQDKYCGVSAMFRDSGCKVTWEAKLI